MSLLQKYFKLSHRDKILLLETTILLVFIKIIVLLLPIHWYSFILGKQNMETEIIDTKGNFSKIYKISQSIIRSRKIIPWESKCLTEAITAKIMLHRRRLQSTIYLGVNKKGDSMIAHAWLRCGNIYVTGRKGMNKFVVLSSFS